jgi:hypothetical protein
MGPRMRTNKRHEPLVHLHLIRGSAPLRSRSVGETLRAAEWLALGYDRLLIGRCRLQDSL